MQKRRCKCRIYNTDSLYSDYHLRPKGLFKWRSLRSKYFLAGRKFSNNLKTLLPGLYKWTSSVTAPADFNISGGADDVWIFQISGDLSISAAVKITLDGGAQAKNIFWQVAGAVELGTTSHFEGVIICQPGITLLTGASLNGKAL